MTESVVPGREGQPVADPAVYVPLPEGLDELAPGPQLGAVLATIDRAALNGHQLVRLAMARQRQLCFEQAQLLADVHELAYTPAGGLDAPPARQGWQDPHAAEEVSFALTWTMHTAEDHLSVALGVIVAVPAVHAAMLAGRIDLAKARVLVDETALLGDAERAAVIGQVLDDAEYQTTGTLRVRLRRLVLATDPQAARKRHQRSLDDRNVSKTVHEDGTCSITGRGLPADKVAAAWDFLCRTATATKKAGQAVGAPAGTERDTRSADQIRADVFCDLLAGADPTTPAAQGGAGAVEPAPRKGVVNLTLELETFLRLNDHPGEIAGVGPVLADIARQVAEQTREFPIFRFQVTHNGRVVYEGRLHRRPTADQTAYVRARDKHCQAPGCRRPAHQCEIDHTTRWDDNGPTEEWNLAVACKRHHRAKDNGGFELFRADFGLLWVSPRGHAYPVTYGRELDATQRRLLQNLVDRSEHLNLRR
jgi:hypothetical protein